MLSKDAKYREIKIFDVPVALLALYLDNYNFDRLQIFSTYARRLALQLSFFDLHALLGPKLVKKWLEVVIGWCPLAHVQTIRADSFSFSACGV